MKVTSCLLANVKIERLDTQLDFLQTDRPVPSVRLFAAKLKEGLPAINTSFPFKFKFAKSKDKTILNATSHATYCQHKSTMQNTSNEAMSSNQNSASYTNTSTNDTKNEGVKGGAGVEIKFEDMKNGVVFMARRGQTGDGGERDEEMGDGGCAAGDGDGAGAGAGAGVRDGDGKRGEEIRVM